MTVAGFDPFSSLDRLMGRAGFGEPGARALPLPIDVYREEEQYVVEVDVPGIAPHELDVTVDRNVLSISGARPARHPADALICERPHARFSRQLYLGENLDTENLQARIDMGVLTITIPLSQQAQSRKINIASETRPAIDIQGT